MLPRLTLRLAFPLFPVVDAEPTSVPFSAKFTCAPLGTLPPPFSEECDDSVTVAPKFPVTADVVVVVAGAATTSEPDPVAEVPFRQLAPFAVTVNGSVPIGVVPRVVVSVSVDVALAPVLVTDEGANAAVTPAGSEPAVNGDVQLSPLPLNSTVTL
jgi:hypothetical protein